MKEWLRIGNIYVEIIECDKKLEKMVICIMGFMGAEIEIFYILGMSWYNYVMWGLGYNV